MIKDFFIKYKIEILEGYMAAAMCFMCMSTLEMNWIATGIVIGIANTYLVSPVVKALKLGNIEDDLLQINHKLFLMNTGRAVVITAIIVGLFYFVNTYFFHTGVEPITFGILYKVIDIYLAKIYSFVKTLRKI